MNSNFRKMDEIEEKWVDAISSGYFKGSDIIVKQLRHASVKAMYDSGYISLKLRLYVGIEKFPFNIRVPIEIHFFDTNGPFILLLHVIDGLVNEIEIFNASGGIINRYFSTDSYECIIPSELML